MIDFETALKIVLSKIPLLPVQTVRSQSSLGRFIAKNIRSKKALPEFNNSSMDGFALNAAFTKGASHSSPILMRVKGEIRAGVHPSKISAAGMSAVKIFTGAPVPRGANTVIKIEEVKIIKTGGEFIKIFRPVEKFENIRFKGENIKPQQVIVSKGSQIRAQEIGLLLQPGINSVRIGSRPKVAILATGDELVQPGQKTGPGKIINVNSCTLAGEVLSAGGIPVDLGIARDNLPDMRKKIRAGLRAADMLIISAGISVGEYDYVKKVLVEYKVKEFFWKVAQRPGEPLFFGKWGRIPVFGLPGNTVSSMVCFKEYVKPAILKMQGARDILPPEINAYLEEAINVKPGRKYFLRGFARLIDGKYFVRTTGGQGSGILKSMADANCLIIIPETIRALGPGQTVRIQLI